MRRGESVTFNYSGDIQTFNVPHKGLYMLEVWGGSGGYSSKGNGAKGGYSVGYKVLSGNTTVYVAVGGAGLGRSGSTGGAGGYNGGGRGGNGYSSEFSGAGGGGGATHMALVTGTLANIGKSTFDANGLIVAGGGGGLERGTAGSGGGLSGGNGSNWDNTSYRAIGGTQSTGYAFGQGQAGRNATQKPQLGAEGNGGCGGGYYGGQTITDTGAGSDNAGSGGSGWIGGVPSITYRGNTYTSSTVQNNRSGDGMAKITLIDKANIYIGSTSLDAYWGDKDVDVYLGDTEL